MQTEQTLDTPKPVRALSLDDLNRAAAKVQERYGMALSWVPPRPSGIGFYWNEYQAVAWNRALLDALNGEEVPCLPG